MSAELKNLVIFFGGAARTLTPLSVTEKAFIDAAEPGDDAGKMLHKNLKKLPGLTEAQRTAIGLINDLSEDQLRNNPRILPVVSVPSGVSVPIIIPQSLAVADDPNIEQQQLVLPQQARSLQEALRLDPATREFKDIVIQITNDSTKDTYLGYVFDAFKDNSLSSQYMGYSGVRIFDHVHPTFVIEGPPAKVLLTMLGKAILHNLEFTQPNLIHMKKCPIIMVYANSELRQCPTTFSSRDYSDTDSILLRMWNLAVGFASFPVDLQFAEMKDILSHLENTNGFSKYAKSGQDLYHYKVKLGKKQVQGRPVIKKLDRMADKFNMFDRQTFTSTKLRFMQYWVATQSLEQFQKIIQWMSNSSYKKKGKFQQTGVNLEDVQMDRRQFTVTSEQMTIFTSKIKVYPSLTINGDGEQVAVNVLLNERRAGMIPYQKSQDIVNMFKALLNSQIQQKKKAFQL